MIKKIDIPFVKTRGFECGQSCAAMIIKFYYPDFKPDLDEINKTIHHQKDMYTFPLQLSILLDKFEINTKCFSSDDYKTQGEDPDQFKRWFGKDYKSNIKYVNREMFDWISIEGKKRNILVVKNTEFDEVLKYFENGNLVGLPIDWNTLPKNNGPYVGHFVVITGLDKESDLVLINDPDVGKDQKYPISLFKKAWEHPVIANDFLIAFGKK